MAAASVIISFLPPRYDPGSRVRGGGSHISRTRMVSGSASADLLWEPAKTARRQMPSVPVAKL